MAVEKASNARRVTALTREIVAQIDDLRIQGRMTQADLYRAAGIPRSSYGPMRDGSRPIEFAAAESLASVFGLTLSQLVIRAEDRIAAR